MNRLGFEGRIKHIRRFFREAFSNRMGYGKLDYCRHVYYVLRSPIMRCYYLKFRNDVVTGRTSRRKFLEFN